MSQSILRALHSFLLQNKKTVAVAESCTGGLVSSLLTRIPGSSAYFLMGVVAYSNHAKKKLLHVPEKTLRTQGAVSRTVAVRMAQAARKLAGASYGIGVTGIAGPSGATLTKPVGTVFIALASANGTTCKKFHFSDSRSQIRSRAAIAALYMLANRLKG